MRDYDFESAGYSVGFLELLGIDQEALTSISLRSKQIDLVLNKSSLIQQVIQILFARNQNHQNFSFSSDIITFDGFPIKIFQQVKKLPLSDELFSYQSFCDEFLFVITEIDVNCVDLNNLIKYREKFINMGNKDSSHQVMPTETFI